jgi:mRNA interferase RelE/StbE
MNVSWTQSARKSLKKLEASTSARILDKMEDFVSHPNPLADAKHLVGFDAYRFRVGEYRVICKVNADALVVYAVEKRDEVYKHL